MKKYLSHKETLRKVVFGLISAIITALATTSPITAQQSFLITSLSANNSTIVEHASSTGDDRGGIALSANKLFYTGDSQSGSFDRLDIGNAAPIPSFFRYEALVSNLSDKRVYSLGSDSGVTPFGGGTVTKLIELDGTSLAPTGTEIALSAPIDVTNAGWQAGIFSGWDRIVLLDGASLSAYNVDLPSGTVTYLGFVNLPVDSGSPDDRCGCENWATWGVAEYASGSIKLAYAASPYGLPFKMGGGTLGGIKRYDLNGGTVETIADFPAGLSDMCSFTVDSQLKRWYFHFEGYSGAFDTGTDEMAGFADASFLGPSGTKVSLGGRVLVAKGSSIRNAVVTITDPLGNRRQAFTNTFGFYRFDNLSVANTYVLTVSAKKYYFSEPTQSITLLDQVLDFNFEADQR